jgi:hypothetical protein
LKENPFLRKQRGQGAKGGALVRPPFALSIVPSAINASAAGIRQIATRDLFVERKR